MMPQSGFSYKGSYARVAMHKIGLCAIFALFLTNPALSAIHVYDHVVIVVEENKSYSQIIGSASAPYINNVLVAEGASFTKSYGAEHPSEGNYLWLFAASDFNYGFNNACPLGPYSAANMASGLIAQGKTFGGYSEDLPSIGSTVCTAGQYWRKHNPVPNFGNIPNGTTLATSCNLRWADWPAGDFCSLRTVSLVVPNQNNDMHDGSIEMGDTWLQNNIDPYYQWAKLHNSLLIVTFDEDSGGSNGLTTPPDNKVATIFAGPYITHGTYTEGAGITHVNVLRTIEDMYGTTHAGAQTGPATSAGISNNAITDVFNSTPIPTTIVRSPSSLSPSTHVGSSPSNGQFTIQGGGAAITYSIVDDVSWLSVNPASGAATCETDTISVIYDTAALAIGNYGATITISDPDASNSPQAIAVSLTVLPPVYLGDFDQDGDVDQKDFSHLQLCFNAPGFDQTDPNCADAKLDADSDVDVADFNLFIACLSGANVTPPISCQQ